MVTTEGHGHPVMSSKHETDEECHPNENTPDLSIASDGRNSHCPNMVLEDFDHLGSAISVC